jgi:hypothetical protein
VLGAFTTINSSMGASLTRSTTGSLLPCSTVPNTKIIVTKRCQWYAVNCWPRYEMFLTSDTTTQVQPRPQSLYTVRHHYYAQKNNQFDIDKSAPNQGRRKNRKQDWIISLRESSMRETRREGSFTGGPERYAK